MSKRLEDNDYLLIHDLLGHEVRRYIEVEFLKNVKERIKSARVEYIVIDNYSDAALEVVRVDDCSFLTYNKYFSESIYKRKFSGREIFVPGEKEHIERYRAALKSFFFFYKSWIWIKNWFLLEAGCQNLELSLSAGSLKWAG